jgi:hypothetical protein
MSLNLRLGEVLLEYDGPALFTAGDSNGNRYVGYQDLQNSAHGYVVLPVNESKLQKMINGVLTVREIVEGSPIFPRFFECDLTALQNGSIYIIGKISNRELAEELLPSVDLRLSIISQSADLIATANSRRSTVACLGLYSAEAEERHVIDGVTLSEAIRALLRLLKRGFSEFSKNLPIAERDRLRAISADRLNVLAFQPGSFEVLIEPEAKPDLFGFQHSATVFDQVTALLNQAGSIDESVATVRGYGGHFGRAYAQFLEVIAVRDTPVIFSWADSDKGGGSSTQINALRAATLLAALRASKELMSEMVTVHGVLEKADRTRRKWRLSTADGEVFQGETEGAFSLDGLTVGGSYSFKCREVMEEEAGTGKETIKLFAYESKERSP